MENFFDPIGTNSFTAPYGYVSIDTCFNPFTGFYETACIFEECIHIIEEYATREEAVEGHAQWVDEAGRRTFPFIDQDTFQIYILTCDNLY